MAELEGTAATREPDRPAMAPLNSERERALRLLAKAPNGARVHRRTAGPTGCRRRRDDQAAPHACGPSAIRGDMAHDHRCRATGEWGLMPTTPPRQSPGR